MIYLQWASVQLLFYWYKMLQRVARWPPNVAVRRLIGHFDMVSLNLGCPKTLPSFCPRYLNWVIWIVFYPLLGLYLLEAFMITYPHLLWPPSPSSGTSTWVESPFPLRFDSGVTEIAITSFRRTWYVFRSYSLSGCFGYSWNCPTAVQFSTFDGWRDDVFSIEDSPGIYKSCIRKIASSKEIFILDFYSQPIKVRAWSDPHMFGEKVTLLLWS